MRSMQNMRKTQFAKIKTAHQKFKQENPKVEKAWEIYRDSTSTRREAEIAKSYKTTTSTKISSIFTTR